MPGALFTPLGDGRYMPTALTRGPWDPAAQHGGAPAALLARAIERTEPSALRVARLTVEFVRPVPLAELRVETEVVRPGRRVQLVEARLRTVADDALVTRALGLRLRRDPGTSPQLPDPAEAASEPVPGPGAGTATRLDHEAPGDSFASSANELRFVRGSYGPGPALAWIRLGVPVVAGEAPSGVQRAAAAADFGNGISAVLDWHEHVFINPDLTVHLLRDPHGEWVGLDAATTIASDGSGQAQSALHDALGPVGRGVQALVVARR